MSAGGNDDNIRSDDSDSESCDTVLPVIVEATILPASESNSESNNESKNESNS